MDPTNRHVIFLATNYPPYTSIAKNSSASEVSGLNAALIALIARRFHWTYSWVFLGPSILIGDLPNQKGLISYLRDGDADTIIAAIGPLTERFGLIDFTMPTSQGPDMILIPYPKKSVNDYSLGHPFQKEVWIVLAVSLITIVVIWNFMTLLLRKYKLFPLEKPRNNMYTPIDYTLTVLLNQGNACLSKAFYIRLVAGVWCLAAAVLMPAYCSTLTSYSLLPTDKPVIDSVYDMLNVPGLRLSVDGGRGVDEMLKFTATMKNTSLSRVARAVQSTTFRCNAPIECFRKVVSGGYVYVNSVVILKNLIRNDLKEHKECRSTLAKYPLSEYFVVWGVAKKSKPYLNILNKGLLEINAFGLSNYWQNHYFKEPKGCLKYVPPTGKKRLSLADTSRAFVSVIVGWSITVLVFLLELLYDRIECRFFKRELCKAHI